jgi:hypothetical protein
MHALFKVNLSVCSTRLSSMYIMHRAQGKNLTKIILHMLKLQLPWIISLHKVKEIIISDMLG